MTREQWLEERKKGIGGSDASAILGLNPYKSNIQLWLEKTGQAESKDISDKPCVKYGNEAEDLLRQLFVLDYPQYIITHNDFEILRHKDYPFLAASLDGKLIERDRGRKGILEIKTTEILSPIQYAKWKDRIPDNYYIQVIHYLLVTGWDFVKLKAQIKFSQGGEIRLETKHYHIERIEVLEDIEYLLKEEIKFWECVQEKRKPNLLLPAI